jgi:hypothetical protein
MLLVASFAALSLPTMGLAVARLTTAGKQLQRCAAPL